MSHITFFVGLSSNLWNLVYKLLKGWHKVLSATELPMLIFTTNVA